MNGIINIIRRVVTWLLLQFGLARPIRIKERCFMPLFIRMPAGHVVATWDYLALSRRSQECVREYIVAAAQPDETPAITFCLTPHHVTGGLIPDDMTGIDDDQLARLDKACFDLIAAGIAVFPCLYVDDHAPRWFEIGTHGAAWGQLRSTLQRYATGYILSIETNERAISGAHIDACVDGMRRFFPGAEFYGTHLQYRAEGRYSWNVATTPAVCNLILMETSNNPHKDVAPAAVMREWQEVTRAIPGAVKIVCHEYNLNVDSENHSATRAALRAAGAWGVG